MSIFSESSSRMRRDRQNSIGGEQGLRHPRMMGIHPWVQPPHFVYFNHWSVIDRDDPTTPHPNVGVRDITDTYDGSYRHSKQLFLEFIHPVLNLYSIWFPVYWLQQACTWTVNNCLMPKPGDFQHNLDITMILAPMTGGGVADLNLMTWNRGRYLTTALSVDEGLAVSPLYSAPANFYNITGTNDLHGGISSFSNTFASETIPYSGSMSNIQKNYAVGVAMDTTPGWMAALAGKTVYGCHLYFNPVHSGGLWVDPTATTSTSSLTCKVNCIGDGVADEDHGIAFGMQKRANAEADENCNEETIHEAGVSHNWEI